MKKIITYYSIIFTLIFIYVLSIFGPGYSHKKDKIVNNFLDNSEIVETKNKIVIENDDYRLTVWKNKKEKFKAKPEFEYFFINEKGDHIFIDGDIRKFRIKKETYKRINNILLENVED
jgi:hypothetical protein